MEEKKIYDDTIDATLAHARAKSELNRLAEEGIERVQARELACKMQCCMCDVLARIPWERAKHVCLTAGQYVSDADFYEPADMAVMACPPAGVFLDGGQYSAAPTVTTPYV